MKGSSIVMQGLLVLGCWGTARAGLDPVITEGLVFAPPRAVWEVFATSEGWLKLGVAKAEIDLRVGGRLRTHYDPQGDLDGEGAIVNEILSYEPERSLAIRIHRPPHGFPFGEAWKSTWSTVTLQVEGETRTRVRFAMLGFGDDEASAEMRAFFAQGNAYTLQLLQAAFPPAGGAQTGGPLDPIDLAVTVSAPREKVWPAFTSAAGWKAFLDVGAKIGTRPGEPFEIRFDAQAPAGQQGSEGCAVLAVVPQELFSFTWNAPPSFKHARGEHTWVVVTFTALAGDQTLVRLRGLGFAEQAAAHPDHQAEWVKVRAYFAQAWPQVLQALTAHLAPPAPGEPAGK